MSKPKIYGRCKVGCEWETVHKEDFLNSIPYATLYEDEGLTKGYDLEPNKKYKIFNRDGRMTWSIEIKYSYGVTVGNENYTYSIDIELPPIDQDRQYFTFELANVQIYRDPELGKDKVYIAYYINDVKSTHIETAEYVNHYFSEIENPLKVYYFGKVLVCNDVGNLTADLTVQAERVFIKYADDNIGTNMTVIYNNQPYMGIYTGVEDSLEAANYTWMYVGGGSTDTGDTGGDTSSGGDSSGGTTGGDTSTENTGSGSGLTEVGATDITTETQNNDGLIIDVKNKTYRIYTSSMGENIVSYMTTVSSTNTLIPVSLNTLRNSSREYIDFKLVSCSLSNNDTTIKVDYYLDGALKTVVNEISNNTYVLDDNNVIHLLSGFTKVLLLDENSGSSSGGDSSGGDTSSGDGMTEDDYDDLLNSLPW